MNVEIVRDLLVDGGQELPELKSTVSSMTFSDHVTRRDVE